jgi:hypothetical protein
MKLEFLRKMKRRTTMTQLNQSDLKLLGEPFLEFRYDQKVVDPKLGLAIFGPHDTDLRSHPKNISFGVIGTRVGIGLAESFFSRIQSYIVSKTVSENPRLWPAFPGFQAVFHSSLPDKPTRNFEIDSTQLISASANLDPNKRAFDVVNQYLDGIKHITKPDDPLDVLVCIVPDIVYQNCRPKSYLKDGIGERVSYKTRKQRREGQIDLFRSYEVAMYQYSVDFRRQLKARAMEERIEPPIQIILESTLKEDEPTTRFNPLGKSPLSDRAWNICTTLFYKAGGKPWRLCTAREGVCYVGIAFRKTDPSDENNTACCAAQMFLDDGDGVVIRGEFGPWFSPEKEQFHLTRSAAKELLTKVLHTYDDLEGKPLREIFLHYRASINSKEFEGFRSACPSHAKLFCVRIRQEPGDIRMYREGTRPILRGTFLELNPGRGYLWTSGFKPFLNTYDGWEIPVPLRIDLQYGNANITQIAIDILGLTKLNYNECKYGDSQPVTIGFSDAVGEILVSNPRIRNPSPKFKYYI